MIRWMCSYTRMDRIRNGVIRNLVKVAPTEDKMRGTSLKWFCNVKRRSVNAPVRSCERINIFEGKRGRGRPQKSLDEMIREDLKVVGMTEDMANDRTPWRDRIRILDLRASAI